MTLAVERPSCICVTWVQIPWSQIAFFFLFFACLVKGVQAEVLFIPSYTSLYSQVTYGTHTNKHHYINPFTHGREYIRLGGAILIAR